MQATFCSNVIMIYIFNVMLLLCGEHNQKTFAIKQFIKADHTRRECGNFDVLNKRAAFASAISALNVKPALF